MSAELLNYLSTKYVDLFYLVSVMMAILQQKERQYLAPFFCAIILRVSAVSSSHFPAPAKTQTTKIKFRRKESKLRKL